MAEFTLTSYGLQTASRVLAEHRGAVAPTRLWLGRPGVQRQLQRRTRHRSTHSALLLTVHANGGQDAVPRNPGFAGPKRPLRRCRLRSRANPPRSRSSMKPSHIGAGTSGVQFASAFANPAGSPIREQFPYLTLPRMISFAGYPSAELFDAEGLREASGRALSDTTASLQYGPTEGVSRLREALAQLCEARGIQAAASRSSLPPARSKPSTCS